MKKDGCDNGELRRIVRELMTLKNENNRLSREIEDHKNGFTIVCDERVGGVQDKIAKNKERLTYLSKELRNYHEDDIQINIDEYNYTNSRYC